MNKNQMLNIKYACVNAAYLMLICATSGYAYNYLSQCGFTDGETGTIITVISILGVLGQTFFGSIIDKSKSLDERNFISITMGISITACILLAVLPSSSFLTILLCVIGFTSTATGMPFLSSMAFIYEQEGFTINYGLGRGVGSAAYAVGSALLGKLWASFGKSALPYYVILFALATLLLVRWMPAARKAKSTSSSDSSLSYRAFFKKYKAIILPAAGMVCIYFCHMLVNTYFAKIIMNIIGDSAASVESVQGTALFIQAMCELPTMFAFGWLINKFTINRLLIFCAVAFSVKHALLLVCSSVPMLYAIMVLQMLTYAILCPGSVYLANEIVSAEDRNKGQAIIGITGTAGGLLSSFIGGQLFQLTSISNVVLVGTIVSTIGSVLMIIGVLQLKKK